MGIPPLPDTTILMIEVGSTAHGTGIRGGEDHDQLAVVVETPEQVLGLDRHGFKTVMQRTQPEGERSGPGDIDRTLHSLRRFVRLAASGNPSILIALWAPVEYTTPIGDELRAGRGVRRTPCRAALPRLYAVPGHAPARCPWRRPREAWRWVARS